MTKPSWLQRVAVIGLGTTGAAVVRVLSDLGASAIIAYNLTPAPELERLPNVEVVVGDASLQVDHLRQAAVDAVVISPGIAPTHPVYCVGRAKAEQAGGQLLSEVELAWQVGQYLGKQIDWYAVTGTNGKTTTVGLVGSILQAAGLETAVVGNVGTPVIEVVANHHVEALAVELSSFQLVNTYSLSPLASVCLNIDSDHLDWHGDEVAYAKAKARVYENTRVACVYDEASPRVIAMVMQAEVEEGCRAIGFSLAVPRPSEVGIVEEFIVDRAFVDNRQEEACAVATLSDLAGYAGSCPSRALLADTLAAVALVRAGGVSPEAIREGLRSYRPAPHRRALLGRVADLDWIDDSKATNAHAAQASIVGLPERSVVWIAGGDTKGQDFAQLVRAVEPTLRGVVVIGADPGAFVEALERFAPQVPRVIVDGHEDFMFSVVNEAVALSRPGDSVVLAPACASWDQFDNYAHRARVFRDAVERLAAAWGEELQGG